MVHSRRVMVARARPRVSRSRAKHSMSGRRAWNRRRWCWWHQLAYWRRSSSYAWRVRPLYPARKPASASRSVLVNTGATGMRAAEGVVVVIGHLSGRAETREAGPGQVPATMVHLTVRPGRVTTQRHFELPKRGRTLTAGTRLPSMRLSTGPYPVLRRRAEYLFGALLGLVGSGRVRSCQACADRSALVCRALGEERPGEAGGCRRDGRGRQGG